MRLLFSVVCLVLPSTLGFNAFSPVINHRSLIRKSDGGNFKPLQVGTVEPETIELKQNPHPLEEGVLKAFDRFASATQLALEDKRHIDELVTCFSYASRGRMLPDGGVVMGQGAVKRFLTDLLVTDHPNGSRRAEFSAPTIESDSIVTSDDVAVVKSSLQLRSAGETRHLDLELCISSGGAEGASGFEITSVAVAGADVGATSLRADARKNGPKWETHDGRVRQQIWQHTGLFDSGNRFIVDKLEISTGRIIAVIDANVWKLHGETLRTWADSLDLKLDTVIAPGNEDHKTMDNCLFMLDELKRLDPLRRSEPVLAIGGGVLTDVAGFACALWRRGVPWARVPTTLLGMVDASVGIKVAVNYHRKNGVGHFFSPTHTFVDAYFLGTLERADVISGCGEIMKAALVHDRTLFDLMDEHGVRLVDKNFENDEVADEIIKRSVDTMLECIGVDLWEEALLRPMDFGHSFSRTLETDSTFYLRHGEAVAIDACMSTLIAEVKGYVTRAEADRVLDVYYRLGLPCMIKGVTADTFKRAARDIVIHRDGLLRAPLPRGIGSCVYEDVFTDGEIEAAFARLEGFMLKHPETCWDRSKSFSPVDTEDN
eukprot:CAMPEP_0185752476 /NCGR_PEP_ID=MMETSP1174-20130828/11271_1 /TAXON_ID=35687 /ORGANISM="Dictyocha speculum, Strain CCMP1381" /LENGTH=599 /DNA_ID=CAMNT_0028429945 /DNA_START=167 /DNA_END=1966 /DNA_ORIENTATION=-